MLNLLLLITAALADTDAYQTCCDTLDAGACPEIIEILGPGTISEPNRRSTTVSGLWMLTCDDGAAWFPAAKRNITAGQEPGGILTEMSEEAIACFASACSLPVRLCLSNDSKDTRILDCDTRESALRSAWLDTRLAPAQTLPLQRGMVSTTPKAEPARPAPARPAPVATRPVPSEPVVVQPEPVKPEPVTPEPVVAKTEPAPPKTEPRRRQVIVVNADPPPAPATTTPLVVEPPRVVRDPTPTEAPKVVREPEPKVAVVERPPERTTSRPAVIDRPTPPTRQPAIITMAQTDVDYSLPNPPPDPCVVKPHLRQPSIDQVELGDEAVIANNLAVAMGHYRAALTINPCNPFAWAQLGSTMLEADATAPAGTALEYATRLMPKHFRAWTELGKVRERQGEWTKAIEAYQEALTHRPGYVAAEAGLRRSIRSR